MPMWRDRRRRDGWRPKREEQRRPLDTTKHEFRFISTAESQERELRRSFPQCPTIVRREASSRYQWMLIQVFAPPLPSVRCWLSRTDRPSTVTS